MKCFLLSLVFALTLTFALCAPHAGEPDYEREDKAKAECNAIYPTTEDPRTKIVSSIITGEPIQHPRSDNQTWCNLLCFLQKVNFFDENANMRAPGVFKYHVKNIPQLAANSHIFLVQLFQIYRSTKGMNEDKCFKAFVTFKRFAESTFVIALADEMNNDLNLKDQVLDAVNEGKPLPEELKQKIKGYLKLIDVIMNAAAAEVKSGTSPAPEEQTGAPAVPAVPAVPAAPANSKAL